LDLIAWSAKKNILLVIDESFIDFSDLGPAASILSSHLLTQNKHVIIVKSISKSYGVPGLRLGMLFSGNVDLIGRLKKDVAIWNINSFAEFFMQIWEKYRNDYIVALEHFRNVRTMFLKDLQRFPWLEPIPSQANYLLCRVHEPYTSTRVAHLLLEQNILIKDLKDKIGLEGSFIRIAIRREEENAALIKALENLEHTAS
jgi:histidinol-phosphate/aromatic aminotransferase/cobyric acid decarboxylase-like protein